MIMRHKGQTNKDYFILSIYLLDEVGASLVQQENFGSIPCKLFGIVNKMPPSFMGENDK